MTELSVRFAAFVLLAGYIGIGATAPVEGQLPQHEAASPGGRAWPTGEAIEREHGLERPDFEDELRFPS